MERFYHDRIETSIYAIECPPMSVAKKRKHPIQKIAETNEFHSTGKGEIMHILSLFFAAFIPTIAWGNPIRPPEEISVAGIGPKGEVLLSYKEADMIVLRVCDPHAILGTDFQTAKERCQSGELSSKNFIKTEEEFREIARLVFSVHSDWYTPDWRKKVIIYANHKQRLVENEPQRQAIAREIQSILDFIGEYGQTNADLARLESLSLELDRLSENLLTVSHVDAMITELIGNIRKGGLITWIHSKDPTHFGHVTLRGMIDVLSTYYSSEELKLFERYSEADLPEIPAETEWYEAPCFLWNGAKTHGNIVLDRKSDGLRIFEYIPGNWDLGDARNWIDRIYPEVNSMKVEKGSLVGRGRYRYNDGSTLDLEFWVRKDAQGYVIIANHIKDLQFAKHPDFKSRRLRSLAGVCITEKLIRRGN